MERNQRKTLVGRVVSDKMDKTITVTLGTGGGGGVIINEKIIPGSDGAAGQTPRSLTYESLHMFYMGILPVRRNAYSFL